MKARLKTNGVFDVVSMSLFTCISIPNWYYVCLINTEIISLYIDNFINNTSHFQINDARQLPIIIPTGHQLEALKLVFQEAVKLKQAPDNQSKLNELEHGLDAYIRLMYQV